MSAFDNLERCETCTRMFSADVKGQTKCVPCTEAGTKNVGAKMKPKFKTKQIRKVAAK